MKSKSALVAAGLAAALAGVPATAAQQQTVEKPAIVAGAQAKTQRRHQQSFDDLDGLLSSMRWTEGPGFPQSRPPTGALRIRRAALKRRHKAQHRKNCRGAR